MVIPTDQRGSARLRNSVGSIVYAVVFVVAFLSAPVALAIAGATALYYISAPLPRVATTIE
jgi:hypothetical protein